MSILSELIYEREQYSASKHNGRAMGLLKATMFLITVLAGLSFHSKILMFLHLMFL